MNIQTDKKKTNWKRHDINRKYPKEQYTNTIYGNIQTEQHKPSQYIEIANILHYLFIDFKIVNHLIKQLIHFGMCILFIATINTGDTG